MEIVIELKQVTKKYGAYDAVKNLSLTLNRGDTLGLIGANGAGKTTTIAMIMGLITPSQGKICIFGQELNHRNPSLLQRMNFQSPYLGMPALLTVYENLNVFGRLYNVDGLKTRINDLVDEFHLKDFVSKRMNTLSAGQKTRVSLAKALLNRPEILLLDEPTASLDPERAEWVRSHLKNYQKKHQATILLSSHNMIEIEKMCDYVARMSYGSIIEQGPIASMTTRMTALSSLAF